MGVEQLISAMDEAATQDIRMVELWPIIKKVLGTPSNPQLQDAMAKLESWYADGGHRRDLTNTNIATPGTYQHNEAITIMDAWWPKLLEAEFHPALGNEAFGAVQSMLRFGPPNPGSQPAEPDFSDGWYGYVSKDPARSSRGERQRDHAGRRLLENLLRQRRVRNMSASAPELAA